MTLPAIKYTPDTVGKGGADFPEPVNQSHVPMPSIISGFGNGELPAHILAPIFSGMANGRPAIDVRPGHVANLTSARKFRAFQWRCWEATGQLIYAGGASDSFRTLARQTSLFFERYSPTGTCGGCKTCHGIRYCKKRVNGVCPATAACYGNSNHGWAKAVDFKVWTILGAISIGGSQADAWARAHCLEYGLCYEAAPEEDWHLQDYTGDFIPAAVLAYEKELAGPGPAPAPGPIPTPTPVPHITSNVEVLDSMYTIQRPRGYWNSAAIGNGDVINLSHNPSRAQLMVNMGLIAAMDAQGFLSPVKTGTDYKTVTLVCESMSLWNELTDGIIPLDSASGETPGA